MINYFDLHGRGKNEKSCDETSHKIITDDDKILLKSNPF